MNIENTNLVYVFHDTPEIENIRETFFFNQLAVGHEMLASAKSEFQVVQYTFEVGGSKKGNAQIEGLKDAFVVKDDIEYGFGHTILYDTLDFYISFFMNSRKEQL